MGTQKERKAYPYESFGLLLEKKRLAAGLAQQSDFAQRLGTTQQTVSRWERGQSRPRADQIPAIAAILNADSGELAVAAGYSKRAMPRKAIATFDQPFPIDSLTADSFERFALYFLAKRYRGAQVHRVGGQGHAQDGVDVDVIFSDRKVFTFQCKGVQEFGPQKVHTAVAKHKRKAVKKHILLARVASPQARQAIREHKGWDIWDKEDMSREIRELSTDEQRRLVDTFFPGQRFALLGTDASSPWQTEEDFFAVFMNARGAFNHTWTLVGRTNETGELLQALANPGVLVVNLEGAGGSGKTRVMKDLVERYQTANPDVLIRFLSPTEDATQKSLEELGAGCKLLIVDDAHERTDLPLLFQYVANQADRTKLLLSYRTYGAALIRRQAGQFALIETTAKVSLPQMAKKDVTALARQVLESLSGPVDAAEEIARLTLDCPLATVLGARVAARERRHIELAKNEESFRHTLMDRFYKVAAGSIGAKSDEEPIRKLLTVLALIQPFNPDDPVLQETVQHIEALDSPQVLRLIRVLSEGGVLFKRGGRFRLSPDLLADHIIEQTCIAHDGTSTRYAERVFDAVQGTYLEQLVVNLGKLDWRRSNGDASNSRLLDGIWAKLVPTQKYGDPHLKAVTEVAYFQPARALQFVLEHIRQDTFLRDLPPILKLVAYNIEHLETACEYLWHLGKSDSRETNPHPEHAIRILKELCEVAPNKPRGFIEATVDFGLRMLDEPDSWNHRYSPFDFLSGILETEGHTTTSDYRTVTWSRYGVTPAFAAPLRKKVIQVILRLLSFDDVKAAFLAAKHLSNALRYPMGGGNREQWATEFSDTLLAVLEIVRDGRVDPVVLVEIARSVSRHAHFGDGRPSDIAKEIMASLPSTLEFRTTFWLVDGYGRLLRKRGEFGATRQELAAMHDALTNDLLRAHPVPEELRTFVDTILTKIGRHGSAGHSSPHELLNGLTRKSVDFAEAIVKDALTASPGVTKRFANMGLGIMLLHRRAQALEYATKMLQSNDAAVQAAVGYAYAYAGECETPDAEDTEILKALLQSKDEHPVRSGVAALRCLRQHPAALLDLLATGNIAVTHNVADDALALFCDDNGKLHDALTEEVAAAILDKLRSLDELDGNWIEEFLARLSKTHALLCASFFIKRVEHADATENWDHRPCNHGPYGNVPLQFRQSPDFAIVLREVSGWLCSKPNASYLFQSRAAELFSTMFAPFDAALISFLREWMETADEADLTAIAHVLHEAPPDLVFREKTLVLRFFERCHQFGPECYKSARSNLFASAISGTRSGTPGEPFPEDLELKRQAEEALGSIHRFAPGRDFYERLLKHADHSISQSLKNAEAFED